MTEQRSYSGTAVALVLMAALLAGLVYRYWPSDERDIQRHLSNLAEALSVSTNESEALSATRFAALREYFAPEVRVRADGQEISPREALIERLQRWTPPPGGIGVEFVDVRLAFADDGVNATVDLTARISQNQIPASASKVESREVQARLQKREGDWVIASVDAGAAH